ncbi:probable G-protein coupled receptor Mth-like 1 [Diprion similis]|uniref:probable G-protein coupled receptor Mth-like 1 n=1 Tax=Diprion similis TaxID=362088 RepID=UPI001EF93F21|nr:probable G-protein coupled receptor Mth-like 1 [Diprion similis]
MGFVTSVVVLLAFSTIVLSEPSLERTRIAIPRCCRSGETLVEGSEGEVGRCQPTKAKWQPLIFSQTTLSQIPIPEDWDIREKTRPHCGVDKVLSFYPNSKTQPFIFFDSGLLILHSGSGMTYDPNNYCAENDALLLCRGKEELKPMVFQCCGIGATLSQDKSQCTVMPENSPADSFVVPNATSYDIILDFPNCDQAGNYSVIGEVTDAYIMKNGTLIYDHLNIPPGQFCIENTYDMKSVKVIACTEHAKVRAAIDQETSPHYTLYAVGFLISVVFLAATLAAGWLLPTAHHVLHWRCQTQHVVCLMLADLLMAIIYLGSKSLHPNACKSIAVLTHFFFLAAFFWLNTMCFNIWWTFRDLRPASLEKGQEILRLRVYACYAWGGPLFIAGLAALLDNLPEQPGLIFLRPRFGEKYCWFYGSMESLTYFFGPVGILLTINVLLFAATARELTCGLWKREVVKSTTERAALGRVCMKLVVVMGVTWVVDLISWIAGGPQYLWYFPDMVNALQGVFIFAVVGCQPQVWTALKRLCNRNPRTNAGRQGNAVSTTSNGMPSMGDSVTQNQSTKSVPLETIC